MVLVKPTRKTKCLLVDTQILKGHQIVFISKMLKKISSLNLPSLSYERLKNGARHGGKTLREWETMGEREKIQAHAIGFHLNNKKT